MINLFIVKCFQFFILWVIPSAGFGHGDGATADTLSSNQRRQSTSICKLSWKETVSREKRRDILVTLLN
jgi:hypothetical protein